MTTSSTGLIMSVSIKTLLVLPAKLSADFSFQLIALVSEEPFSFHSLSVSPPRMRGTAYSAAGMGYYLLAWHTHTHTQWKQIG